MEAEKFKKPKVANVGGGLKIFLSGGEGGQGHDGGWSIRSNIVKPSVYFHLSSFPCFLPWIYFNTGDQAKDTMRLEKFAFGAFGVFVLVGHL